ncbi:hypothetical protein BCF50_1587 [Chryseobacterium daecheongense]|uniref:Uncharacterized protein n=1 Tax=Chryseobacterium daecheongense TaxID=192389 RepID=A0ABY2FVC1_9FLAO|nr:hypothetical protein [Chryseobacterium daecheongense]TDX92647.1 hypothetical protein BCF50_1587 [Chryseobacterium daecheongense]
MNCSGWKKEMAQKGSLENVINNAIIDFSHTSSLAKKNKVFYVSKKEYDNIIGVRLKHEGYNQFAGNPAYKYKYNGKETSGKWNV